MSGHRPPDPPAYDFDAGELLQAATALGMKVKFKLGAHGYGWVFCPRCGWGQGDDETDPAHWLLDLSFYQREPWGCAVCRGEERASPTTERQ